MVLKTLCRLTFKSLLIGATVVLLIVFIPGLPPHVPFEPFSVTPPIKLEKNSILDKAELLVSGKFIGPESVAGNGDTVYTGVEGGNILQYKNGKTSVVANTGTKQCVVHFDREACGRPLGIRFRENSIWVADAFRGLLTVNPGTGTVKPVFPPSQKIEGRPAMFPDDLDLSKDGTTIYWSDASKHSFENSLIEMFGNDPSGRLIKFDRKTKTNTVLIDNIHFANGVQLSQNEDFVLICETIKGRIRRYHLKGPRAGTHDIFVDGLPALPDNVRSSGRGTFFISLIADRSLVVDTLKDWPSLRKFVARTRELLLMAFYPFDLIVPNHPYVKDWKLYIAKLEFLSQPNDPGYVVEVDEQGKILRSFQGERVRQISEFSVIGPYAYLGSPFSKKLWRIKVADLK